MIKAGVIGAGSMGKNHVRVYSEMSDVELFAVVDKNKDVGEKIGNEFNVNFYEDYGKVLDEVDAVSIAAPTKFHYEIAKDAFNKGVDVLIEKPIALNLREADELIKLAKSSDLILQVGHIERFNPAVIELKKFIDKDIYSISANRIGPFGARITDAGVVLDLMIHDIDIILSLIDGEIESISAYGKKINSEHEDLAYALIKFRKGCIVKLTASRVTQKRDRRLKITMEDKYIELDYMNKVIEIYRQAKAEYVTEDKNVRFIYSDILEKPYVLQTEPLKLELRSFIDCVKTRKEPVVSGIEGRNALDVALKILNKINQN